MEPLLHRLTEALAEAGEVAVPLDSLARCMAPWLGGQAAAAPRLRRLIELNPQRFRLIAEPESHILAALWTAEARARYSGALRELGAGSTARVALRQRPDVVPLSSRATASGDSLAEAIALLRRTLLALSETGTVHSATAHILERAEALRAALARVTIDGAEHSTIPLPDPPPLPSGGPSARPPTHPPPRGPGSPRGSFGRRARRRRATPAGAGPTRR